MSAFNLALKPKYSGSGFTLIELLIVISVMMVAISLVGPTTLKMVDKAKAQTEFINLQNQIKKISYNAFASASEYKIEFKGSQVKVYKNSLKLLAASFEYLSFNEQSIELNSRGYPYPEKLVVDFPARKETLNLFRLIEGTSGKVEH